MIQYMNTLEEDQEIDVTDYVTFEQKSNGEYKITQEEQNKSNLLRFLYDCGFRRGKVSGKSVYFKRINGKPVVSEMRYLREAFYSLLKESYFTGLPQNISRNKILNWYLRTHPVKNNKALHYVLNEELSSEDQHTLRMQVDTRYKREFELKDMSDKLRQWEFSLVQDIIGSYSKNAKLFYKHTGDNQYLVFSQYLPGKPLYSGFDCWLTTYNNKNDIGNKRPNSITDIRLTFKLDRDFELIQEYVIGY